MKVSLLATTVVVALIALVGVALAGFDNPKDAIRYRQAVMTVMGHQFGKIAAVVKGAVPDDPKTVEHDAAVIHTMATLPWDAMLMPGSHEGDTTLKPMVMKEQDKFMALAHDLEKASRKLVETAASGDPGALRSQFVVVAGDCKTCHSTYRRR